MISEPLGCFGDTGSRAIPTLEGSDYRLDGDYGSRQDPLEKCINAAFNRGFDVFALQNGGWCASSESAAITYDQYGPSSACQSDGEGGPWANEVYAIVHSDLVCEHQILSISCSYGTIHIVAANYGRTEADICQGPIHVYDCRADTSIDELLGACEDKESCSIEASNSVFGDPCVGTFKYLQVKYYCEYTLTL